MTQYEFINILKSKNIDYIISTEDEIIIKSTNGNISFNDIKTLPDNIIFRNNGYVLFDNLRELPNNIVFYNTQLVYLGKHFNNKTIIYQNKKLYVKYIYQFTLVVKNSININNILFEYIHAFGNNHNPFFTSYIISNNDNYAHGHTLCKAIKNAKKINIIV